jgi:hypothetical protein
MILLKILDHDLHAQRRGSQAVPLYLETPAIEGFLPAVVSSSRGKFLVSRRLTKDGMLRSGVFNYDYDRLDDLLGPAFEAAFNLSVEEKWGNVFRGPKSAEHAFAYVRERSGTASQPHACLLPSSVSPSVLGKDLDGAIYKKTCRTYSYKGSFCVFLSRPDFVGMHSQIVGSKSSIILHNVKDGMAFSLFDPPDDGKKAPRTRPSRVP